MSRYGDPVVAEHLVATLPMNIFIFKLELSELIGVNDIVSSS